MASENESGGVTADIPKEAVEEALRSVEKHATGSGATAQNECDATEGRAVSAEVESLRAQLDLSQEKARETLERLKDEHERFLRAAADLENYRKRAQKEREEIQKFGIEKLLKDLIPILDNLERALRAASASEGDPLSGGVKLVLRGFEETLGRYGVKAFGALGQPFDPRLHEALLEVGSDEPPGTVVLEHGRGYFLHERLVRPAMVGVAVARPQSESSAKEGLAQPAAQTGEEGSGSSA
jgi:molecular chaperone GrpE